MLLLEAQVKEPVWHSVSCVCEDCIRADTLWISRYGYTLRYGKRPLFERQPCSE